MLQLIRTTSNHPHFNLLIQELDHDLDERYGLIQLQYKTLNKVENIDTVILAFSDDIAVGCGCFKPYNATTIEIKRFYLKPGSRGQGIADQILSDLENWANELGYSKAILETGIRQPEAIRFYTKKGFVRIENFGNYQGNSNSICFGKAIS
jgi:putative acetyltransferase